MSSTPHLLRILLCALLFGVTPGAVCADPPLRVLVLKPGEEGAKGAARKGVENVFARLGGFETVFGTPADVSSEQLKTADILLLEKGASALGEEQVEALSSAVQNGLVLLVDQHAVGALPDSTTYSALLGRKSLGPIEKSAVPLAVAVRDQSHPITQCVTHFQHRGPVQAVKVTPAANVLANALVLDGPEAAQGDLLPAFWVIRQQLGTVAVTSLDHRDGPSRDLVVNLLARAAQWGARRRVDLSLPPKLHLVAPSLSAADTGLAPGRPPALGFYRGRQIAPVMSYHGADWLLRPEREKTELPEQVVDSLEILPGQQVADIGAGNGYFSLRLADRVGPKGKVYAVEIQPEMLDLLKNRAARAGVHNIVPVLGKAFDPGLPPGSIDLVLMVDVYHELSHPQEVLASLGSALKKNGRVVLVEYRGEDPTVPIKPLHRMTVQQAQAELEAVGFRLLEVKDFVPHQHILIFGKVERSER